SPILAQSRHPASKFRCPLLGVKRTRRNAGRTAPSPSIAALAARIASRQKLYKAALAADLRLLRKEANCGAVSEAMKLLGAKDNDGEHDEWDEVDHARKVRAGIARLMRERRDTDREAAQSRIRTKKLESPITRSRAGPEPEHCGHSRARPYPRAARTHRQFLA